MITATETVMNATRVPIETMSANLSRGTRPASRPTTTATTIVLLIGVMVRGLTLANIEGSNPSRPMANRIRVDPYSVTRVTEKIEMTAPAASTVPQ